MRFTTFLLKNLMRRKVRSLLTAIGVAVAVGTTVSLRGISESFTRSTAESLSGLDMVVVERDTPNQLSSDLDQSQLEIVRQMPEVSYVNPSLFTFESIRDGDIEIDSFVQGWEPDSKLFDHLKIEAGRVFNKDDGAVAVIGKPMAKRFDLAPGDTIEMCDATFEIIGVFDSSSFHEEGIILVPLIEWQRVQFSEGRVTGFSVVCDRSQASKFDGSATDPLKLQDARRKEHPELDPDYVRRMAKAETDQQRAEVREKWLAKLQTEIREHDALTDPAERLIAYTAIKINLTTDEQGNSTRFLARPAAEYVSGSLHLQTAHAMADITSLIAVVVGAIGMLNTMIMSVVERVREISTLRAIGWRKSRVVRMIIGESLILSLVGAVIGVIGAIALTKGLSFLPMAQTFVEGDVAFGVIMSGFALALLVGFFGGIYPAFRAAQMLPSEGLRHE